MIDRLFNYLFSFLVIALFVLVSDPSQRIWILAALGLGTVAVLITFLNNTLTIDGAGAALVIGVISMGLGKWVGLVLILFFFCSSYGLSWWLEDKTGRKRRTERRSGKQVWANAFWFVLLLVAFYVIKEPWMLICAASAIAAATSDTWSSLAGVRLSRKARMITNFRRVPSGTDGAVSFPGTLSGLAGAMMVALLFLISSLSLDPWAGFVIFLSGFSGCVADSYLGAIFQYHKPMNRWLPDPGEESYPNLFQKFAPDNSGVNFLATGIAAIIAFFLY